MEIEQLGLDMETKQIVSQVLEKSRMSLSDFMKYAFEFYAQVFNGSSIVYFDKRGFTNTYYVGLMESVEYDYIDSLTSCVD